MKREDIQAALDEIERMRQAASSSAIASGLLLSWAVIDRVSDQWAWGLQYPEVLAVVDLLDRHVDLVEEAARSHERRGDEPRAARAAEAAQAIRDARAAFARRCGSVVF